MEMGSIQVGLITQQGYDAALIQADVLEDLSKIYSKYFFLSDYKHMYAHYLKGNKAKHEHHSEAARRFCAPQMTIQYFC